MLLIATFSISTSQACITLESPRNGAKSHPTIKHFSESHDTVRQIILHNENSSESCIVQVSTVELIQKLDGGYQFLDAIPGFNTDRSLLPYMDVRNQNGQSVINTSLVVAPKSMVALNYFFNFSSADKSGSYHAGVKLSFPNYSSYISIVETYFTFDSSTEEINLLKLDFNPSNKRFEYTLENAGDAYTFFRFEVTLIDPLTSFERSIYQSTNGSVRRFLGNIRNFPLPKSEAAAKLSDAFSINNFTELFKNEFSKQYPGQSLPNVLIAVITPSFGIDHANWKNHHYRFLKRRTFTITNPY